MRVLYAQFLGKVPFKAVAIVLGAGAAAAAGFAALSWTANASRPVAASEPVVRPARVMEIAYQRRSQSLVLAGTVVPRIETTLGFRVAGKMIARDVDVGTVVKPGDLIARSIPTDYRLAVDNARAALASAEADYARAKADLDRYQTLRGTAAFMPRRSTRGSRLARPRPGARRAGQEPALLGREQPRLHRAARRRRGRHHRRAGRGRPGAGAGPGHGEAGAHRRARDPGRRARAPAEDRARGEPRQLRAVVRHRPSLRRQPARAVAQRGSHDPHLSGALHRRRAAAVHRHRHDGDADPRAARRRAAGRGAAQSRSSSRARSPPSGWSTRRAAPSRSAPSPSRAGATRPR